VNIFKTTEHALSMAAQSGKVFLSTAYYAIGRSISAVSYLSIGLTTHVSLQEVSFSRVAASQLINQSEVQKWQARANPVITITIIEHDAQHFFQTI